MSKKIHIAFSIVFLLFLSTELINGLFERQCIADVQCAPGERCIPNQTGLMICQNVPNNMPVPVVSEENSCQSDTDCPGYGGKCVHIGWYGHNGVCKYGPPGWKVPGAVNDQCHSDADCGLYQQCVENLGTLSCQVIPGKLPYKQCHDSNECNIGETCVYNLYYNINLCSPLMLSLRYGATITCSCQCSKCVTKFIETTASPFWESSNGAGVKPTVPINSGIVPSTFENECSADYQCSVFETCSGKNTQGKRICNFNPYALNRHCRFHADCQPSQRCEKVHDDGYYCKVAKLPTFMQPCIFDYECSSDQHCSVVSGVLPVQQNIRRCIPKQDKSSCYNDADCVSPRVCRLVGNLKQCVLAAPSKDFGASSGNNGMIGRIPSFFDFGNNHETTIRY